MQRTKTWIHVGFGALLMAGSVLLVPEEVAATDNRDGEALEVDRIADLADLYAWRTDRDTIIAILTFAVHGPGDEPELDPNVLYTLHIDNTARTILRGYWGNQLGNLNDNESDIQVHVRFARNSEGRWGMEVSNLPGARQNPLIGLVGRNIDGGARARVAAGVFDNPFAFDIEGYRQTIVNVQDDEPNDLAFASILADAPADGYAGTNVWAIALEFSTDAALDNNDDSLLQLWATAARIGPPPDPSDDGTGTGESGSATEESSGGGTAGLDGGGAE